MIQTLLAYFPALTMSQAKGLQKGPHHVWRRGVYQPPPAREHIIIERPAKALQGHLQGVCLLSYGSFARGPHMCLAASSLDLVP